MLKLSEVYATGFGTPVDMVESVRYLKMAADAGDGESRYRFSLMLRNGEVVRANAQLADEYLKKAAQAEWLPAQLDMARKLQADRDPEFVVYLEAAAENGDDEAYARLGRIYRFGEGVPINLKNARRYLRLAADRGGEADQRNLAEFLAETQQSGPQPDE
jgi:TPR repeat protein